MKAAEDRSIAFVRVAQRKRAMRAAVLKTAQYAAKALHKNRAGGQTGSKPVAVFGDIAGVAEKCPDPGELRLLTTERRLVDERVGPIEQSSLTGAGDRRLSFYSKMSRGQKPEHSQNHRCLSERHADDPLDRVRPRLLDLCLEPSLNGGYFGANLLHYRVQAAFGGG